MSNPNYPETPDGRYFAVKRRLWRLANPALDLDEKERLVRSLMHARRAVRSAKQLDDIVAAAAAHRSVDDAKRVLGERGPVWWTDGAPDYNRHMVKNSPYADWYERLTK